MSNIDGLIRSAEGLEAEHIELRDRARRLAVDLTEAFAGRRFERWEAYWQIVRIDCPIGAFLKVTAVRVNRRTGKAGTRQFDLGQWQHCQPLDPE